MQEKLFPTVKLVIDTGLITTSSVSKLSVGLISQRSSCSDELISFLFLPPPPVVIVVLPRLYSRRIGAEKNFANCLALFLFFLDDEGSVFFLYDDERTSVVSDDDTFLLVYFFIAAAILLYIYTNTVSAGRWFSSSTSYGM